MGLVAAYWPYAIAFLAVSAATGSAYSLVVAATELRDSNAAKIRGRVRDLSLEDHGSHPAPRHWVEQAALLASSGWPKTVSRRFVPVVRLLDKAGIACDLGRLRQAGLSTRLSTEDMLLVRGLLAFCIGLFLSILGVSGGLGLGLLFLIVGIVLGSRLPSLSIAGLASISDRTRTRDLPEMADMLALGARAGMGFDRALELYVERFDGPLAEDFGQALTQWKYGALSRDEALEELVDRLANDSITRMVGAIGQAMRLGSPLARVLDEQARDARTAHRSAIEERIGQAPVKMLLPMGTLILPAMLILLLGPIMLNVLRG